MNRYRLTFDPNPKELARRDSGPGRHVALLWSRRTGRAAVVVDEEATGELIEVEVAKKENPLELYHHPLRVPAYPGTPGPWRNGSDAAARMTVRQRPPPRPNDLCRILAFRWPAPGRPLRTLRGFAKTGGLR